MSDDRNPELPYGITEQEVVAEADTICGGEDGHPCPSCYGFALAKLISTRRALHEMGVDDATAAKLARMPSHTNPANAARAASAAAAADAAPHAERDPRLPRRIVLRDELIRGADMAAEAGYVVTTRRDQARAAAEHALTDAANMANLTPEARQFLSAVIRQHAQAEVHAACAQLLLSLAPTEADHDAALMAESQARRDAINLGEQA